MSEETKNTREFKIAMLIDGDNAQPHLIKNILTETGKYGTISLRRIYGDWTTVQMKSWKETLHTHAIQPIQQFRYTIGKNATDSALIIDAMDILHSRIVTGFCIVSSDSDFTRLATRIREEGLFVIGIGQKKTPNAFVNACDVFVFTENLISKNTDEKKDILGKKSVKKTKLLIQNEDPFPLIKEAFEMSVQEDEWCHLAQIGINVRKLNPSFDPRTYGYKQLLSLIEEYPKVFQIRKIEINGQTVVYIKLL